MFLSESEFGEFNVDNVRFTNPLGLGMPLSEAMSILYEGSINIKGEDQAALIDDAKVYIARTEKILNAINANPEKVLNSKEFIDLVQLADLNNDKINAQRKKLLKITDQELQMTDTRIFNRVMKGEAFIKVVKEEYAKTFKRVEHDLDTSPRGALSLFIVGTLNVMFRGFAMTLFGPTIGLLLGTALIAPINEEIARYTFKDSGSRSFTYMINIMETINYTTSAFSLGVIRGLFIGLYRVLFCTNLHQIAETKIQSEKLRSIVEKNKSDKSNIMNTVVWDNLTVHTFANSLSAVGKLDGLFRTFAMIFQPLLIIWEFLQGRFRNTDLYESTEMQHNNSLFTIGLIEGCSIHYISNIDK